MKANNLQTQVTIERYLKDGKIVRFVEPCDCGDRIMHNNGGNYHQIVEIKFENNKYYSRYDDTCELKPSEPFVLCGKTGMWDAINYSLKNGYDMEVTND